MGQAAHCQWPCTYRHNVRIFPRETPKSCHDSSPEGVTEEYLASRNRPNGLLAQVGEIPFPNVRFLHTKI